MLFPRKSLSKSALLLLFTFKSSGVLQPLCARAGRHRPVPLHGHHGSHHEGGCCRVMVPALSRANRNTAGAKGGSKGWDRQEVHFAQLMILAWKLQTVRFIGVSNRHSTCPDTSSRTGSSRSPPSLPLCRPFSWHGCGPGWCVCPPRTEQSVGIPAGRAAGAAAAAGSEHQLEPQLSEGCPKELL